MKEEKKEKNEIVVLDEGIGKDILIGPEAVCCYAIYIPYMD